VTNNIFFWVKQCREYEVYATIILEKFSKCIGLKRLCPRTALVEKSIEISIGFLHRKLAYGAPKNFYGTP
jgi:hypothetical protein